MEISKDRVVGFDYRLTDNDGQELDTSDGREPLYYIHGSESIIPGLEARLEGKSQGEQLQVQVPPDEAYGERQEGLQQVVDREQFADVEDLAEGMQFRVPTEEGETLVITIVDVKEDAVTVDGNHPLAGVTLNFDITIKEVREATQEELSHGHVHGHGEHEH